jgi:hypothetical protein
MRKILMATALTAIVGATSMGVAAEGGRACDDHGNYTAATGWKIGTWSDLGRDGVEACSDDAGVVRAGRGGDSAYVAVDTDGGTEDYVYVTTGEHAGIYCGKGDYDRPAGFDPELDAPESRDAKRTDACT